MTSTWSSKSIAVVAMLLLGLCAYGCGDDDGDDGDRDSGTGADSGTGVDSGTAGDGGGGDAGGGDGGGGDAGGGDGGDGGGGDGGPPISFSVVYEMVIDMRCNNSAACHGAGTATTLDMSTEAMAYDNLINEDAMGPGCMLSGLERVVPSDAAMSLLWLKVNTAAAQPCGSRMPAGGMPALSAEDQALIRDWINGGAIE